MNSQELEIPRNTVPFLQQEEWKGLKREGNWMQLTHLVKLGGYLFLTIFAVVLWQPLTAILKFYRDGKFDTSQGKSRLKKLKKRRYHDLSASRADIIETSIEATFEPLVQGYIMFPSIITMIDKLNHSIEWKGNILQIGFELESIEIAQLFSIISSVVSLAWCFSDYTSVKKHLQLDIGVSPFSRLLMCIWMTLQVTARLLAFMLFTVYWGPGNIYPLIIFTFIHMILASIIHVVFSEDVALWKRGRYLKFVHNVILNSFASIYFHNYIILDEMPKDGSLQGKITKL